MKETLQTCADVEERGGEINQQLVKHPDVNDEMRHAHRIRLVIDRLEMPGITD